MNTIIVPLDFSDASINAAEYAAGLLNNAEKVNLLLYHAYHNDWELESSEEKLLQLKERLEKDHTLNISISAEKDNFIPGIERLIRHKNASLVIMSHTGRSALAEVFIGSNALKISESKACPVLLIPGTMKYNDVTNIMIASDFQNVRTTTPSTPIKTVLNLTKAKLHVVNVNSEHYVAITEEFQREKKDFEKMFSEFDPEFYFLHFYDVTDALSQFATDKNIDIIITIQKQHAPLYRKFRSNHIKNLQNNCSIPLMVVHE